MLSKVFNNILLAAFLLWTSLVEYGVNAACSGRCEKTTTNHSRDAVENHVLEGHTMQTLTSNSSYTCHYKCFLECRCLSYRVSNAGCELMDEDRSSKPADFQQKIGYQYYDMRREYYQSKDPQADVCLGAPCENECCKSQPCLNSGQCTELCDNPKLKFTCKCTEGYIGKLCQHKARSCKDYINDGTNGNYVVFDKDGNKLNVFCDFLSEKGFAWTLVESFSLENNGFVKSYAFYKDHPLNENDPNWVKYRLLHTHMKQIAKQSTYFRATCQFPIDGVKYVDYLRGRLIDFNLVKTEINGCVKNEYLNIRGHHCNNCTAITGQTMNWHMHIDSYFSDQCGRAPVRGTIINEDNFGWYAFQNSLHRCSINASATTQWWLGGL